MGAAPFAVFEVVMNRRTQVSSQVLAIAESEWNKPIRKSDVLKWMKEDDIEILGALQDIITEESKVKLIDPPLERAEIDQFFGRYFERCIRENPQGEWALSRYMAAHELNRWFLDLWEERPKSDSFLKGWKKWFEKLYRGADETIKRAVVDGSLEHLFEEKGVSEFFADWKKDAELSTAFDEAKLWSDTQPETAGT